MSDLRILDESVSYICRWDFDIEKTHKFDVKSGFVQTLGVETLEDGTLKGHVVVKNDGVFRLETATGGRYTGNETHDGVSYQCTEATGNPKLYVPIDPRMTAQDIEGAKYAEPNADGTAWVFHHETIGEHRDHELQLMAVIEGIFRPVFHQYGYDHLSGATDTHRNLAIERHGLLASFYGQIILNVQKKARSAYLSERQTSHHFTEGHLYSDLHSVFSETKKKWVADNTAEDFAKVSGAFAFIERRLAIPAPETRWDRAARLKKEAEANSN